MQSKKNIYDLHCHILPGMDDGAQNCEESYRMLQRSRQQGVAGMIATPHYYPKETVESFLKRRRDSYEQLQRFLDKTHKEDILPEIQLGAEVAFHTGLAFERDLEKLCLGHSRYLLLEMPFHAWNANILREVRSLKYNSGLSPVIAHIERFLKIGGREMVEELMSYDFLFQMNAGYILDCWKFGRAKKLLRDGKIHLIGSDCHNMDTRLPNMGPGFEKLHKKRLGDIGNVLIENGRAVYLAASGDQGRL